MGVKQDLLRKIPSVEKVLEQPEIADLGQALPRWAIADSVREVLALLRQSISTGRRTQAPEMKEIMTDVGALARRLTKRGIRSVINATGIVIHTNLGRANLSEEALEAVREVATSYSSLEFDLYAGTRTSRTRNIEKLLTRILGSEDAFVVNNNAGAVLLALNALAEGKEVIVSRGELIEIGGSFRLPDVMEKSGAKMVDIGTTNRTRIQDYENAITKSTRILLKVHWSNFIMTGFVESVPVKALAELAHQHGLLVMEDLGSGALVDLSRLGMKKEPMPQESLKADVDIVTFSGDKLLGGPQAGMIVGKKDLIHDMKENPLARALRVDKMTLAAMEETLRHYLEPETLSANIPVLRSISCSLTDLEKRAQATCNALSERLKEIASVVVAKAESQVGGGSLPTAGLDSYVVSIASERFSANEIVTRLRQCEIPVVARILEDKVIIDFRTVQPSEDGILAQQVITALAGGG